MQTTTIPYINTHGELVFVTHINSEKGIAAAAYVGRTRAPTCVSTLAKCKDVTLCTENPPHLL